MGKQWFVVRAVSGQEKKVKTYIEKYSKCAVGKRRFAKEAFCQVMF